MAPMLVEKERTKGFGISSKTGVLYSTYSTLTSNYNHPTKSRLLQIVAWCGGEAFDGCILFDECHKAKHGELSDKNATASKIAQAVQKIQTLLPNARVVYCSATGVGGIEHMAYMSRLGLWGPSTAFHGFSEFLRTIKNRGMGAMEMLAIEMKLQGITLHAFQSLSLKHVWVGKYLSRGLSYTGAEFELDTVALTDSQRRVYDNAVAFWNILIPCMERAAKITRVQGDVLRVMWGFHQHCLASGHCAVIGLQTTGEASMERSNLADSKSDTLVSLCERILIDLVTLHFPTKIKLVQPSKFASTASNSTDITNSFLLATDRVYQADIGPDLVQPEGVQDSVVCVDLKNALLAKIPALKLPPNPLDHLLDALGGETLIKAHPALLSSQHMNEILIANLQSIGLFPPVQTVSVKLFLNRLLGLAPALQNALFHYFEKTLQSVIAKAQQEGKYDEGYDDIKGRKAELMRETNLGSNVTYSHVMVDRGISWEDALSIYENVSSEYKASYYISDQKYFGEYLYILMITGSRSCSDANKYLLCAIRDKYTSIPPDKAERGWKRIFDRCETRCIHTSGCKQGESCRVGIRKLQYHLLSGSLLPIWKLLEQLISSHADVHNRALRIVRITLTNSAKQKLVGVNFPPDLITTLQAMLITLAANAFTQVEPVTPIHMKTKERVGRAKRTILNFFSPQVNGTTSKRQRRDESTSTSHSSTTALSSLITPAKKMSVAKKASPPTKQHSVSAFFSANVNSNEELVKSQSLPPPTMCIDLVSSDDEA
ncbi:hypothetical protein DYB32_003872 [Aphanomyces invadans]|uniref:Strawberry notch AAA domain-containing protein n=1 Tax=Aphanomyces invadans TaxID=157072 RepID=A0A3R6ZRT9_9STRA|nr:hypothetical protein DYB32_003872 [Aphanomyces invadans]